MPARQVKDTERARQADLAAIHIGKKALGWSDDEYRDIMATVCGGVRSAGGLDQAGRKRFLAHIQACARLSTGAVAKKKPRTPLLPEERKVWSLWMQLADAHLVRERSMAAINAWIARQTGVSALRFCNEQQKRLVIESLKRWLDRREEPQP